MLKYYFTFCCMTIISSSILLTTRKLADGKKSVANRIQSPCLLHFLGEKESIKFGVCVMNMHTKE